MAFFKERIYWDDMTKDIKELVQSCWKCEIRKRPRNTKGKLHTITAERKLEQVQIDL